MSDGQQDIMTLTNGLMNNPPTITNMDEYNQLKSKLEPVIDILSDDIKSMERQLNTRQAAITLAEQTGTLSESEAEDHKSWLDRTSRAMRYKQAQMRTLEKTMGNARSGIIDRKYLYVAELLEVARRASAINYEDSTVDIETRESALVESLENLDRAWQNWDK